MCEPFISVVQCRVKFSQCADWSQSCSLEPASGCYRWPRWKLPQRWGILWNSLTDCVLSCFCFQGLQFNVEARTWTQIGKLQMRRVHHGLAHANLSALCRSVGNLNQYHYHKGANCPNLFKSAIGKYPILIQFKKRKLNDDDDDLSYHNYNSWSHK